jgi:hypothetical protein
VPFITVIILYITASLFFHNYSFQGKSKNQVTLSCSLLLYLRKYLWTWHHLAGNHPIIRYWYYLYLLTDLMCIQNLTLVSFKLESHITSYLSPVTTLLFRPLTFASIIIKKHEQFRSYNWRPRTSGGIRRAPRMY